MTLRHKILAVLLSLTLIITLSMSGVYYALMIRDVREFAVKQSSIAVGIILADLASRAEQAKQQMDTVGSDELALELYLVDVSEVQFAKAQDAQQRWVYAQEVIAHLSSITEEVEQLAALLKAQRIVVYNHEGRLLSLYRRAGEQDLLGMYLSQVSEPTFIPLRTDEDKARIWVWSNIEDIPKQGLPPEFSQPEAIVLDPPPSRTTAVLTTHNQFVTSKLKVPIYRNGVFRGLAVVCIDVGPSDIEEYVAFGQTDVNFFAGPTLSVGSLPEYQTLSSPTLDQLHYLDLLQAKEDPLQKDPPLEFSSVTVNGARYYQGLLAFGEDGEAGGAIAALVSQQSQQQKARELTAFVGGVTVILGAIAVAVSYFLGRRLVRPLEQLEHAVEQVGHGNMMVSVPVSTDDEIGQLARAFNTMAGQLAVTLRQLDAQIQQTRQEIKERRKAEAALQQLNEELEQRVAARTQELAEAKQAAEAANRAKSIFLANMNHELRTPLNAILGFTQLMAHDVRLDADMRENIETINRSGSHLLMLINDVLAMSKIESGRMVEVPTKFDFYATLEEVTNILTSQAKDKGLRLLLDYAPHVPRYIQTDEGKLRQVLMNLVSNAIKFTEEGGVTLRVGISKRIPDIDLSPGATVPLCFEVEDTGPGIAPEELDDLFEPFVQTESGWTSQEGTGLGLSISQRFVRLMGGTLTVDSELGQGSCFKFTIPVHIVDAAEVKTPQPRKVVGVEPGQPAYRILIAEDHLANRQFLHKLLSPLNFELHEAMNGQEALLMWEDWRPHLILMDMRMPDVDGLEATRQIKNTERGQSTPVIALTASAFEEDREELLAAGCDDFISKPFRTIELFDKLSQYMGVRFIYADTDPSAAVPAESTSLSEALLADLAAEHRSALYQAVTEADFDRMLEVIKGIRLHNPILADKLLTLVQNFEYDTLLKVLSHHPPNEGI